MAQPKTKRRFNKAERRAILGELKGDVTGRMLAERHGVSTNTITAWKKANPGWVGKPLANGHANGHPPVHPATPPPAAVPAVFPGPEPELPVDFVVPAERPLRSTASGLPPAPVATLEPARNGAPTLQVHGLQHYLRSALREEIRTVLREELGAMVHGMGARL